jgi:hypothetical protein
MVRDVGHADECAQAALAMAVLLEETLLLSAAMRDALPHHLRYHRARPGGRQDSMRFDTLSVIARLDRATQ